jgi:hypothetical protein
MKEYYIISLKCTYTNSGLFTFCGTNNNGYTWWIDKAGVYTQDDIDGHSEYYNNGVDTLAVEKSLVDNHIRDFQYYDREVKGVMNQMETRGDFGVDKKKLIGGMSNILEHELKLIQKESV